MINNLNVNGTTYQNVAKLRVKRAGANTYADLVDTSDSDAVYTDIKQGKSAYVNGTKVIGTYVPPTLVSQSASGDIIVGGNQQLLKNVISFFDEYGALLHTIDTTDNTQFPLSELPSLPPSVTNYTFSWNKTLQEVNAMTTGGVVKTNVVVSSLAPTIYIPDDCGWTMPQQSATTITLAFSSLGTGSAISLTIDWGDGTATSTLNLNNSATHGAQSSSHTFSAGVHTNPITITPSSSVGYMLGGWVNSSYNVGAFYQYNGQTSLPSMVVKEIRMGDGAQFYQKNSNQTISNNSASFRSCVKLEKIIIPNGVTYIGNRNFGECYSLQTISLPDGLVFSEGYEFYNCNSLSNVLFGNTQTTIPNYALASCGALTSIDLKNITSIGDQAFNSDYALDCVLPNGLTSIGNSAFSSSGLTEVTIPNTVTSIGNSVFSSCSSLRKVVFESGSPLTTVGYSLFNGDYSLEEVSLPNGLTAISQSMFYNCKALKDITIPSSVTDINTYAFYYCYALRTVTIPSSVTNIGSQAFYACCGLRFVSVLAENVPTLGGNAFPQLSTGYASINNNYCCLYYVPSASLSQYKTATNWATYANNMRGA